MFRIEPLPERLPQNLVGLLERVETATIGHVLHSGFVDPAIRAVLPDKRVAGTAVTLRPHDGRLSFFDPASGLRLPAA